MGKQDQMDYGKKFEYDPTFEGPIKRRSCTDVICLAIFLGFILGWAVLGIWALKNGDPNNWQNHIDSSGLRCGVDPTVENLPYLFYFDVTECQSATVPYLGCSTKQVCVSKCPNTTFYNSDVISKEIAIPYCTYEQRKKNTYNETNCPKWFLASEIVHNRCLPSLATANNRTLRDIEKSMENSSSLVMGLRASISAASKNLIRTPSQDYNDTIQDVMDSWWKILVGVGIALVSSITYILMLRWFASFLVWFSIYVGVAALTAVTVYLGVTWQNEKGTNSEKLFLGLFILSALCLLIIVLLLISLRSKIRLAIVLMQEGSKAISAATSVLFFPIVSWVLQILVTAYALGVWLYLYTSPNSALANCKFVFQVLNIFGFFWLTWFVSALGQMVLAQVFAEWYWTMRKRNLPFFALTAAVFRTLRYHLGTLAFGSLIIAIIETIKFFLKIRLKRLDRYNIVYACICCCCNCCFNLFPKFITKNAYIMCAIHGKNFCRSARDAFMLIMRNIVRVFVLNKVTSFVLFISEILVTAGVGAVSYLFLTSNLIFENNTNSADDLYTSLVLVVLIMIITFLISCLFFNVYSVAIDTIFLCFLEDCERNNGKDRPYYMSRDLWKIIMKKGKEPKYE